MSYPEQPQHGYNSQPQQGYNPQAQGGQQPAPQQPAPGQYPAQQQQAPGQYPAPQQQPAPAQYPAPQQQAPGQYSAPQQAPGQYPAQYAPQANYQSAPRQNPFAGLTVRDYVLDGLPILLLLISLFLHWNAMNKSTDLIAVILVTVLTLFTVSIHHLARAGILPASLGAPKVHLLRVLALVPYVALAAVFALLELIKVFKALGDSLSFNFPALGAAYFLGLSAVILIAVPRSFEEVPENRLAAPAAGLAAVRITAAAAGATSLFATVFYLIVYRGSLGDNWLSTIFYVLLGLLTAAVVASPALLLRAQNTAPILRILPYIGAAAALQYIFADTISSLYASTFGVMLLPLIGAAAFNPVLRSFDRNHQEIDLHQRTASVAALAVVPVAGLALVAAINHMTAGNHDGVPAGLIITSVLLVFVALAAVFGATQLKSNPVAARNTALGVFGAIALISLVIVIIGYVSRGLNVTPLHMVLLLGLPTIGVYSLVGPKSVRDFYSQNRPARPAPGQQQPGQWSQPAAAGAAYAAPGQAAPAGYPATAQSAPATQYASAPQSAPAPQAAPAQQAAPAPQSAPVAQPAPEAAPAPQSAPAAPAPQAPAPPAAPSPATVAADPAASGQALADISANHPELRAVVAANPATYPELLQWLGALGDPQVNAALAARGSSAGTPQ